MTRKLIVNADDNGWTRSIVDGITKAFKDGIVTSCSVITNTPAADYALTVARKNPSLSAGVHMNLNTGRPISPPSEVPTLVDGNGVFPLLHDAHPPDVELRWRPDLFDAYLLRVNPAEVEKELDAQIQKYVDSDVELTHLDSNYGFDRDPRILDVEIKLAKKYGVPLRVENPAGRKKVLDAGIRSPDRYISDWFGAANITKENLMNKLSQITDGVTILGCHPGFPDEYVRRSAGYHITRAKEVEVLTDPDVKKFLQKEGIELVSYREIMKG